jgi:hypothetical protein
MFNTHPTFTRKREKRQNVRQTEVELEAEIQRQNIREAVQRRQQEQEQRERERREHERREHERQLQSNERRNILSRLFALHDSHARFILLQHIEVIRDFIRSYTIDNNASLLSIEVLNEQLIRIRRIIDITDEQRQMLNNTINHRIVQENRKIYWRNQLIQGLQGLLLLPVINNPQALPQAPTLTSEYFKEINVGVSAMESQELMCSICQDDEVSKDDIVFTSCNHSFCVGCVGGYAESLKHKTLKPVCPCCRTEITELKAQTEEKQAELKSKFDSL